MTVAAAIFRTIFPVFVRRSDFFSPDLGACEDVIVVTDNNQNEKNQDNSSNEERGISASETNLIQSWMILLKLRTLTMRSWPSPGC